MPGRRPKGGGRRVGGAPRTATADHSWMGRALGLAKIAGARAEVPIGALVVAGTRVLGRGANRPIAARDPTAHAEIVALRGAARAARNYRLPGTTLYVTLEPCLMCLGAMVHARIDRLVFGARDPKIGAAAFLRGRRAARLNHRFEVTGGVRAGECAALLRRFFHLRRRRPARGRAAVPRRAPISRSG